MALKISFQSNGSKFLAKPCEGLQDFPGRKEWEDANRISLMDNELCTLPEFLHCHNLSTLLLQRNNGLIAIPKFFFQSMRSLRVLDLHGTGIESLPSSISDLICLRGLYLNSCTHLIQLPPNIRALDQLELLDIRGTKLNLLQIGSLIWLKCLRISSNFFIGIRTQRKLGNISRFVSLEEFCVDDDLSVEWRYKASEIVMEDSAYSYFLESSSDYPSYNSLKLVNGEGWHPVIKHVLKGFVPDGSLAQLTTLTLTKCPELKRIFSSGMIQQLPSLQHLRVEECYQIEEIIMVSENHGLNVDALPRLKTLVLIDLPKLRSIWVDDSLEWPSLQRIKISMCYMLKRLPFNNANAAKLRFIEGQELWWKALVWKDDAVKQRLKFLCILN
ncbi:Disease resistance protein RPS2 [Vitis vinifera]|uniref:Disease resistance protein RPS2 n=1 Tax=Vitis vinifera TaxID=29760 RepID=A0A438E9G1_VITVI|nr:Disease resistance protein RPS2 [Vitis vinifera]